MSRVRRCPLPRIFPRALFVILVVHAANAALLTDLRGQGMVIEADPAPDAELLFRLDTVSKRSDVIQLLRRWYHAHGYFESTIDTSKSDTIVVTGGDRYSIGSIVILLPDSLSVSTAHARLQESLDQRPYSDSLISGAMDDLLATYESSGYPLARVSVNRFRMLPVEHSVRIVLRVEPGDPVVFDNVRFLPEGTTSQGYLLRVTGLEPGQIYSPGAIESAKRALYRTGLFLTVKDPEIVRSDSGFYTLQFNLEERSVNTFDGAIGYQPSRQANENGFVSGTLAISLRNILGGGERIEGAWSKLDEATSDLRLLTEFPFVWGSPFGIEVTYNQRDERESSLYTSYLQRDFRAVATLDLGTSWRVESGVVLSGVIPAPDTLLGPCSSRLVPRTDRFGGVVGLAYDSRDLPINPRQGVYYRSDFEFSSRSVNRPDCDTTNRSANNFSRQKISTGLSIYRSISGPFVFAAGVSGSLVAGEEIDITELVRIGGANSVRGYREGQYRGSRELHGSLEGRVLLSEQSHGALFFDGGYFYRPSLSGEIDGGDERGLLGYGVALQIDTPAGVARVSVGLASGSNPEDATLSVGLAGSF